MNLFIHGFDLKKPGHAGLGVFVAQLIKLSFIVVGYKGMLYKVEFM